MITGAAGVGSPAASAQANAQQVAAPALVFDGAAVVDVERGTLVPAQRVVVVGNRVQAVGATGVVRLPPGATVVDVRGKYLIPGLWDMHVHNFSLDPDLYKVFLVAGITGVRDMMSPIPLDALHRWRRQVAGGERLGPRVVAFGRYLDPVGWAEGAWEFTGAQVSFPDATPVQGRRAVDSLKRMGADFRFFGATALARGVTWPIGIGFSPAEVLQMATLNPAKMLQATDSIGTVAPGKLADLVLLDADPLADIANVAKVRAVVANGRYLDRAALDQLWADAHTKTYDGP